MQRNIIIIFSIIFIISMLTYFSNNLNKQDDGSVLPPLAVGDFAYSYNFSFNTVNQTTHSFHDFKGQTILVHFWATWCPPCVVEFPILIETARKNPNLVILAFSNDTKIEAIDRFLIKYTADLPENFLIIHDSNKHIAENIFGTFRLPETYVINEDLKVIEKMAGAFDGWADMDY